MVKYAVTIKLQPECCTGRMDGCNEIWSFMWKKKEKEVPLQYVTVHLDADELKFLFTDYISVYDIEEVTISERWFEHGQNNL